MDSITNTVSQRQYQKEREYHRACITDTASFKQYHTRSFDSSSLAGRRCGTGEFWTAGAGAATPPPPLLPPLLPLPLTTTATTTTEIHPPPLPLLRPQ